MSLKDWLRNGWLIEHQASNAEIRNLLGVADRDLADCRVPGLSSDWCLNIAYNAALQAATAALAAAGYRASRESHHYRVIQSLVFTIGSDARLVRQFDQFRKKRNIGGYERSGVVSDQEAKEMQDLARKLRDDIQAWIVKNHPGLFQQET